MYWHEQQVRNFLGGPFNLNNLDNYWGHADKTQHLQESCEGCCGIKDQRITQEEWNEEWRKSSVEVIVICMKLAHLDVSWTGDEEDGSLTNEARLMFSLGRFIKWTKMPW